MYNGDVGLSLYEPTPSTPKYRLVYVDPFTGDRRQPRRTDRDEAIALFNETVAYLHAAQQAEPLPKKRRHGGPATLDDLFDRLAERWRDDGCSERYISTRSGLYDYRIRPVFGHQTLEKWASSNAGCREVLRTARVQGLAPSSLQNLGALMRALVTLGWDLRWIPESTNPMKGVKYVAGATEQGQKPEFVHQDDRPEFDAVDKLILAYDDLAAETGIFWLPERTLVGAYAGLRPGERDALRLCDLRPDQLEVRVDATLAWSRSGTPIRKPPKNGKRRNVLVPASTMDRLLVVAERRRRGGAADDALLFEDPRRPGLPLSAATRRLHIEAALRAGWETVEVRRRADAQRHLGPDLRPRHTNYSLRHHAAVWMHDRAEMDWADVSRMLGHHSVAFTFAVYVLSGADADARNRIKLLKL